MNGQDKQLPHRASVHRRRHSLVDVGFMEAPSGERNGGRDSRGLDPDSSDGPVNNQDYNEGLLDVEMRRAVGNSLPRELKSADVVAALEQAKEVIEKGNRHESKRNPTTMLVISLSILIWLIGSGVPVRSESSFEQMPGMSCTLNWATADQSLGEWKIFFDAGSFTTTTYIQLGQSADKYVHLRKTGSNYIVFLTDEPYDHLTASPAPELPTTCSSWVPSFPASQEFNGSTYDITPCPYECTIPTAPPTNFTQLNLTAQLASIKSDVLSFRVPTQSKAQPAGSKQLLMCQARDIVPQTLRRVLRFQFDYNSSAQEMFPLTYPVETISMTQYDTTDIMLGSLGFPCEHNWNYVAYRWWHYDLQGQPVPGIGWCQPLLKNSHRWRGDKTADSFYTSPCSPYDGCLCQVKNMLDFWPLYQPTNGTCPSPTTLAHGPSRSFRKAYPKSGPLYSLQDTGTDDLPVRPAQDSDCRKGDCLSSDQFRLYHPAILDQGFLHLNGLDLAFAVVPPRGDIITSHAGTFVDMMCVLTGKCGIPVPRLDYCNGSFSEAFVADRDLMFNSSGTLIPRAIRMSNVRPGVSDPTEWFPSYGSPLNITLHDPQTNLTFQQSQVVSKKVSLEGGVGFYEVEVEGLLTWSGTHWVMGGQRVVLANSTQSLTGSGAGTDGSTVSQLQSLGFSVGFSVCQGTDGDNNGVFCSPPLGLALSCTPCGLFTDGNDVISMYGDLVTSVSSMATVSAPGDVRTFYSAGGVLYYQSSTATVRRRRDATQDFVNTLSDTLRVLSNRIVTGQTALAIIGQGSVSFSENADQGILSLLSQTQDDLLGLISEVDEDINSIKNYLTYQKLYMLHQSRMISELRSDIALVSLVLMHYGGADPVTASACGMIHEDGKLFSTRPLEASSLLVSPQCHPVVMDADENCRIAVSSDGIEMILSQSVIQCPPVEANCFTYSYDYPGLKQDSSGVWSQVTLGLSQTVDYSFLSNMLSQQADAIRSAYSDQLQQDQAFQTLADGSIRATREAGDEFAAALDNRLNQMQDQIDSSGTSSTFSSIGHAIEAVAGDVVDVAEKLVDDVAKASPFGSVTSFFHTVFVILIVGACGAAAGYVLWINRDKFKIGGAPTYLTPAEVMKRANADDNSIVLRGKHVHSE